MMSDREAYLKCLECAALLYQGLGFHSGSGDLARHVVSNADDFFNSMKQIEAQRSQER